MPLERSCNLSRSRHFITAILQESGNAHFTRLFRAVRCVALSLPAGRSKPGNHRRQPGLPERHWQDHRHHRSADFPGVSAQSVRPRFDQPGAGCGIDQSCLAYRSTAYHGISAIRDTAPDGYRHGVRGALLEHRAYTGAGCCRQGRLRVAKRHRRDRSLQLRSSGRRGAGRRHAALRRPARGFEPRPDARGNEAHPQ